MSDALATLGIATSIGVALAAVIVALMIARIRRTSRKNSELEELRDVNLAAMGYIYTLESAYQEACHKLGFKPDWEHLDKPKILQRSYLVKKAEEEGNREIANLADTMKEIQEQLKGKLPPLPTKD